MKNNKGFTLIELLAVIVILGIIITIATLSLSRIKEDEKSNSSCILNKKIENAAKLYVAKYYAQQDEVEFNLSALERDGLIELKSDDGCNDGTITVTGKSDDYYNFSNISCYNPSLNCD